MIGLPIILTSRLKFDSNFLFIISTKKIFRKFARNMMDFRKFPKSKQNYETKIYEQIEIAVNLL